MSNTNKTYGAKADVYINHDGNLQSLGMILKEKLSLDNLYFDTDIVFPHEEFATGETLGFEFWLKKLNDEKDYNFIFSICTSNSDSEILDSSMYNISGWLSAYLQEICFLSTSEPRA